MKTFGIGLVIAGLALALLVAALPASAQGTGDAMVRVVHASPDAPAVDICVNGNKAFTNAAFKAATNYANLKPGAYDIKVIPAGGSCSDKGVIEAKPTLAAGPITIAAVGKLANIEPLILKDNLAKPAAGKAHVRFVHASPDAPAVDIAVKGGPVLFSNVAFKGSSDWTPVNAGTYDLEVRPAGKTDVVLAVPGVTLKDGDIATVFAMGLASGDPKLVAVPVAYPAAAPMPTTMPATGDEPVALAGMLALIGIAIAGFGFILRRRAL
ncbi:MAG: DUF4397 domain-containing protein [Anaerolineae bacterium]